MTYSHRFALGLIRAAAFLYPANFRIRFSAQMVASYESRVREKQGAGAAVYGLYSAIQIVRDAFLERVSGGRSTGGPGNNGFLLLRRSLLRRPGYFITASVTLAVGLAATASVLTIVDMVLFRALPYPDESRLVQVGTAVPGFDIYGGVSVANLEDVSERVRSVDRLAAVRSMSADILAPGTPRRVSGASTSATLFPMLGAQPAAGRLFEDHHNGIDAPPEAIVTTGLAELVWGGNTEAVGSTVNVNGVEYTVIGVLSRSFESPEALVGEVELWVPQMHSVLDRPWDRRGYGSFRVLARLAPEFVIEDLETELSTIAAGLNQEFGDEVSIRGQPLAFRVASLYDMTVGTAADTLLPLLAAVTLFLLVAVSNVVNLMLARVLERAREFSILSAIGASRRALVGQVLGEAASIAIVGGLLGVLISDWALSAFGAMIPADLPRLTDPAVDLRVLLLTLAVALISGTIATLAPAFAAATVNPAQAMGVRSNTASKGGIRLRRTLVAVQTALSMILLTGAALLSTSLRNLASVDPGFSADGSGYVTIFLGPAFFAGETTDRGMALRAQLRERIFAVPNVTAVTTSVGLPLDGNDVGKGVTVVAEGREDEPFEIGSVNWVGEAYFETLGIPLIPGSREFESSDFVSGAPYTIVNEQLASEAWPGESALGKRIQVGPWGWLNVVGVAGNVKTSRLDRTTSATLYLPDRTSLLGPPLHVTVRASVPFEEIAGSVREAVREAAPSLPLGPIESMSARVDRSIAEPRFYSAVTMFFSAAGVVLAAIGLYGTLSYAVGRTRGEIGVRLALGASMQRVAREVMAYGLGPVVVGLAGGTLATVFLTRLIGSLLFEVEPGEPAILLLSGALLLVVALLASTGPALRAAQTNPVDVLRTE